MQQDENGRNTYPQPLVKIQFGGDQLNAERIRSSQLAVINGKICYKRFEEVFSHAVDFRCSVNFVSHISTNFYEN